MKGPLNRIDLDVRRVWECPTCHKRRKADGEIVSKRCFCTKEGGWMQLVELRRQVRTFPRPVETPEVPSAVAATDDDVVVEAKGDGAADTVDEDAATTEIKNDE